MNPLKPALLVSVAFVGLSLALGGFYTVEQGERAVVLRWGAMQNVVSDPGLHFKIPVVDSVTHLEVRTQKAIFDKVATYSADVQQSSNRFAVNYRLPEDKVLSVFSSLGINYADRVLTPIILDKSKEIFGKYTAASIVAERAKLGDEVTAAVASAAAQYGIVVEQVQIENIDFTDSFEQAIELAVKAKAEVTQAEQVLRKKEVEAKSIVVQAEANANAARAEASGKADALRMQAVSQAYQVVVEGKAKAEYLEAQGKAIRQNPEVIELTKAQHWDGKLPSTMLPGTTVPFLNVK